MKGFQPLLESALEGDKQAFCELVKGFRSIAASEAGKYLIDKNLVEDVVQEAFIKAYLRLSDLKDPAAFPAWFKKIIRTCCRKHQAKFPHCFSDQNDIDTLADPGPTPYEIMLHLQNRAMVVNTIQALKGNMREVSIQHYLHGRSCQEIAATLGLPLGTVKRRLHDARAKFIEKFKKRRPSIRVGYLPVSDHLLAMVAHYMHDRQNYEILLKKFLSWSSLVKTLKAGLLDAAFIMAPLALSLRAEGMSIIYVLDAHHNGSAITVRKDASFVRGENWGRVGLPYAISTHSMILHSMIDSKQHAAHRKIETRYISPSYLNKSLATHNIDAFFCAEPWNTKAAFEGIGRILARSSDIYPGHICCVLVAREEFAGRRGEILREYIKLLLAANERIVAKPDFCAKIQARYTGISADIAETVLRKKVVTYQDLTPDRNRIESVMTLATRAGILKRPCDLDSFIRTDFI